MGFFGQAVFGAGRELFVFAFFYQAGGFQHVQALGQGPGVDALGLVLDVYKAPGVVKQAQQDQAGPFVAQNTQGRFELGIFLGILFQVLAYFL